MMTCTSERSGTASNAIWREEYIPHPASSTALSSTNMRFFSDHSMMHAIMSESEKDLYPGGMELASIAGKALRV